MSKTGEVVVEERNKEREGEIETGLTGCEEDQLKIINKLNLNSSTRDPKRQTSEGDVCGGNPANNRKGDV